MLSFNRINKKIKVKIDPIKRSEVLLPLSREHHHGLLLCWKIRTGFKKSISLERVKAFTDWFYNRNLKKHFELEEDFVFPILGKNHPLVKKAISEHKRLIRLFEDKKDIAKSLSLIEEELEKHIRFEERILFHEIEQVASKKEIMFINEIHEDCVLLEDWEDEFWK
jgi:iron-sulfur cluster repair protein YtfE (RIC family)